MRHFLFRLQTYDHECGFYSGRKQELFTKPMPPRHYWREITMVVRYVSAVEGAQHGGKKAVRTPDTPIEKPTFFEFCRDAGAFGAQPSNYQLFGPDGKPFSARQIKEEADRCCVKIVGFSIHCLDYVEFLLLGGTLSKGIRPFIPKSLRRSDPKEIIAWCREQKEIVYGICQELGIKDVATFHGPVHGLEVASGYPWPFFNWTEVPGEIGEDDYDLVAEGDELWAKYGKEALDKAASYGVRKNEELHHNTLARNPSDFHRMKKCVDNHSGWGINDDWSHGWHGHTGEQRTNEGGEDVNMDHIKVHRIIPGRPLLSSEADWKKRGMMFATLSEFPGTVIRNSQVLIDVGYPQRYALRYGTDWAPLVVEAESAYYNPDQATVDGVRTINELIATRQIAEGSFEKDMGA